jgi:subtilisin family serine protease
MLDVWSKFALAGPGPHDLLLVARDGHTAGEVAQGLAHRLRLGLPAKLAGPAVDGARIVAIQATAAARLTFPQLIRGALPMTRWWSEYLCARVVPVDGAPSAVPCDPAVLFAHHPAASDLEQVLIEALDQDRPSARTGGPIYLLREDLHWLVRVAGGLAHLYTIAPDGHPTDKQWQRWIKDCDRGAIVVAALRALLRDVAPGPSEQPLWAVHVNREAEAAVRKSTPTIKADAARQVFDVTGRDIRWAVVDSGIDATHMAFRRRKAGKPHKLPGEPARGKKPEDWTAHSRITRTYDFTHVRELMGLTATELDGYPGSVPAVLHERLGDPGYRAKLREVLVAMESSDRSASWRSIDWNQWKPLLCMKHVFPGYREPRCPHGTQVAGILAADWRAGDSPEDMVASQGDLPAREVARTGVCPEIELWDIRVLDDSGKADEFSTVTALQFVRAVNAEQEHQMIHGVNVSFSLPSNVEEKACGSTPVCVECERLIASGVVVVAAAGNLGRARYLGASGEVDEGYRLASITDPGNASGVITVGATHRFEPHHYGVSYFSSRGPTGDGRAKPDLVAPGEKIETTAPGNDEREFTGTSAAAPHVSGAAALLLCRYAELRGRPAEVKRILCDTATDLGRDRYCQGAGLVDILRAMESV